MNKIMSIFILVIIIGNIYSQNVIPDTYFLKGVGNYFEYWENGVKKEVYEVGKRDLNVQLEHFYKKHKDKNNMILIGHSLGGLKALAYASYVSQLGEPNRVKGVITMGSPLKGFTALARGREGLNRQMDDWVKKIADAVDAAFLNLRPLLPGIAEGLGGIGGAVAGYKFSTEFRDKVNAKIDLYVNDATIPQLTPGSEFLKKYIEAKVVKTLYGDWYLVPRWIASSMANDKTLQGKILIDWNYRDYKCCQVYIPPVQVREPRINKNIYVGMIVGQNNDLYQSMSDSEAEKTEKDIRDLENGLKTARNAASVLKYVFCLDPCYFSLYQWIENKCSEAVWVLENFNTDTWGTLLGGRKNDFLITEDSQQRDLSQIGGKPINFDDLSIYNPADRNGIKRVQTAIHHTDKPRNFSEYNHPEIWGQGGGAVYYNSAGNKIDRVDAVSDRLKKGAIKKDSVLGRWYDCRRWVYE